MIQQGVGEYSVATEYLMGLVNVGTLHGLSVDECFSGSGVEPNILLQSPYSVGNVSMRVITNNILKYVGLEMMVCNYLNQIGNFSHGPLSLVLQSSNNLSEALRAISLFSDTRVEENLFDYRELTNYHSLELFKFPDHGDNRVSVDKFIHLSTILLVAKGMKSLFKSSAKLGELTFSFSVKKPELLQSNLTNYNIHFNQANNSILFYKGLKFSPVILDRSVYRDAFQECESIRSTSNSAVDIVSRVRFELSKKVGANLTIVDVASTLCMCPRSLQRKLASHGYNFRKIKSEEQAKRARHYLENTLMPIEQIAVELGYSHPSNFIKNFKATFDLSPLKYREYHQKSR